MKIKKRNGKEVVFNPSKITKRIKDQGRGLKVDSDKVAIKVIGQIGEGITSRDLDILAIEQSAMMVTYHPDYNTLASKLFVTYLHKETLDSFSEATELVYEKTDLLSDSYVEFVRSHKEKLNSFVVQDRDFNHDYFGLKTLERSYLISYKNKSKKDITIERPQYMWLRTAIEVTNYDISKIEGTYKMLSTKRYTHATPTLFNSGTKKPQMSSCFLLAMQDDSVSGIYDTLKQCALISQSAGGIGVHMSNVRPAGSHIRGTNGVSNGIVPMMRVYNDTARYIDQCFEGRTNVYTSEGLKPISDVMRGDKVLTDDGKYNRVLEKRFYEKSESDIIKFKTILNEVSVTDIHPLLGIKLGKNSTPKQELERLRLGLNKADYFESKEFSKGDYLGRVIPTITEDVSHLSCDDFRFYGILLGDGSISSNPKKVEAKIYLGTKSKEETIKFVESYLNKNLIKFKKNFDTSLTSFYVYLPTNPSFKFGRNDLYSASGEKRILPNYLNIPLEKSLSLIKGLIETDGSIKDNRIKFYTSSPELLYGLDYLLLRAETPFFTKKRDRIGEISPYKGIVTKKMSYEGEIPKNKMFSDLFKLKKSRFFKYLVYEGVLYTKIKKISRTESTEKVNTYDLSVENNATYTTQLSTNTNGGGKRKGSFAMYIEPWHRDIFDFLDLKKNHGKEENRARDLFYAIWMNDLFMERVEKDEMWSLFCPNEVKKATGEDLQEVYGEEFKRVYEALEASEDIDSTQVKARELWDKILVSQIETGTPYLGYKDRVNECNNQKNYATIKSSNLCIEINQVSNKEEVAVCNLASIALNTCVVSDKNGKKSFSFKKLEEVVSVAIPNLDNVITNNFYPVPEARNSNMLHRPVGLGVQGLADTFALLKIPFDSEEARSLNKDIFEHMYYYALTASNKLAIKKGVYPTFKDSPAAKGQLQFDLYGDATLNPSLDWNKLKEDIISGGLRNSLLIALMPTASTSQIHGNNEAFEAFTSNLYVRRTLSGEFIVLNKHLVRDLEEVNLWNESVRVQLIQNNGSVMNIPEVPTEIRERYKTSYEMSMKAVINMAADRQRFVCQSQSMNLFVKGATVSKLTSMHFYGWKLGLKTGIYYLRSKSAVDAKKITVDAASKQDSIAADEYKRMIESAKNSQLNEEDDDCLMCGS